MQTISSFKTPNHIIVYDAPPFLGGNPTSLPVEKFQDKFGITFSEGLSTSDPTLLKKVEFKPKMSVDYVYIQNQLAQLEKRPFSGLCLAYIGSQVGYGVFATRDIPADTVIGVYSGVIRDKNEQANVKYDYSAQFSGDLYIDAGEVRGLGAFMQHLPHDHERYRKKLFDEFKSISKLAHLLKQPEFVIEAAFRDGRLTEKSVEEIARNASALDASIDTELTDIEFSDKEIQSTIASANITREFIPYKDSYEVALITLYPIKRGEIVGFTYTSKYWEMSDRYPELFSKWGSVVPKDFYKRNGNLYLTVKSNEDERGELKIRNNRHEFLKDVENNQPVNCGISYVSVFEEREELVRANAVPKHYGSLPNNTMVERFSQKLKGTGTKISLFWDKPQKIDKLPRNITSYSANIVFQAKDTDSFAKLTHFFTPIKGRIKEFPETKEIVLCDVNTEEVHSDENLKKLFT